MIKAQVRLPIKVAFDVVLQGIRIRFGRSVVTVLGVVFGIAFLMSILTSQALKKGVSEEDLIRSNVTRMYNFLTAEMGPPADRTVGLIVTGPFNEAEGRLLKKLEKEGLSTLVWTRTDNTEFPDVLKKLSPEKVLLQEVGNDASAVLVTGEGAVDDIVWAQVLSAARQKVVAVTRARKEMSIDHAFRLVRLQQEMKEDEQAQLVAEKRKTRFRNIWITVISLLVTVIGISNAMLMSVTERFREIGTMKCLGALSAFVRTMFLIESALMGIIGGLIGCGIGVVFSIIAYGITYGFGLIFLSVNAEILSIIVYVGLSMAAAIILSVVAAIYPASIASRMVPADALRSNV